ncbi:MAG: hypothetical protein KF894_14805 [Labilithrix sp.]|nr:hypothetical protein [Labilithrix sp.]
MRDWRAGGQTAEAFADGQQFEASTLTYWVSRLNRTAPTTFAGGAPPKNVAMPRVIRRRRNVPRKYAGRRKYRLIVVRARDHLAAGDFVSGVHFTSVLKPLLMVDP